MLPTRFATIFAALATLSSAQTATGQVVLHVGAGYMTLPATEFRKVQSLAQQDLFLATRDADHRAEIVGMIGHDLWSNASREIHVSMNIGTTARDPGAVLLFGPSIRVAHAFLSAGVATSMVERGMDAVVDEVYGGGQRELFERVERQRAWGIVLSLSFGARLGR